MLWKSIWRLVWFNNVTHLVQRQGTSKWYWLMVTTTIKHFYRSFLFEVYIHSMPKLLAIREVECESSMRNILRFRSDLLRTDFKLSRRQPVVGLEVFLAHSGTNSRGRTIKRRNSSRPGRRGYRDMLMPPISMQRAAANDGSSSEPPPPSKVGAINNNRHRSESLPTADLLLLPLYAPPFPLNSLTSASLIWGSTLGYGGPTTCDAANSHVANHFEATGLRAGFLWLPPPRWNLRRPK